MEPDDLLCSRNARPQKALVGRAQWKINQPPSLKRQRASLEGSSRRMRGARCAHSEGPCLPAWKRIDFRDGEEKRRWMR
jgi:hypothetical protein